MTAPVWFASLAWSAPVTLEALRAQRSLLPHASGVYAFSNYAGPLENNTGVLYIGKAKSLSQRVQSYLVDPATMMVMSARSGVPRINTSLRHAGKVQLLVEIQQKCRGAAPSGIWVRWSLDPAPAALEKRLIDHLQPAYNTQGVD